MALLTRDERRNLIDLLMNLPNITDPDARLVLMADLPRSLSESVDPSDPPRVYLTSLINNAESATWSPPVSGEWPLATLLQNAIDLAADTTVGQQLKTVLDTIQTRIAQGTRLPAAPDPAPTPADTAPPSTRVAAGGATTPDRRLIIGGGVAVVLLLALCLIAALVANPPGGGSRPTNTPLPGVAPTATVAPAPTDTAAPGPTDTAGAGLPPLRGRLAFTSRRGNGSDDVYVTNADGSQPLPRRLTDDPAHDYSPSWEPGGRRLVFASYRNGQHGLYIMNADGSNATLLLTLPSNDETSVRWSPDGQHIVYVAKQDNNLDLFMVSATGGQPIRLTDNLADDSDPAWSPDSQHIAFASKRNGPNQIHVLDLTTRETHNLSATTNPSADDFLPAWSPDGARIAFTSRRDGNEEIYVMRDNGLEPVNLTRNPARDYGPTWSPDGHYLAFASDRTGNPEVFLMPAAGGDAINLTNNPAWDFQPAWWAP